MKKFIVIIFIALLFTFYHKVVISKIISINISKWTEKEIFFEKININYFKNEIILDNLEIRSTNKEYYKNIIEVGKIKVKYNFKSLFTDLIKIDYLYFSDIKFFLEVNDKINSKDNSKTNSNDKAEAEKKPDKNEKPKVYPEKKKDKNFFILKTKISNSKAFIKTTSMSEVIKLDLSDMSFVKVGNEKKFQHFKEVFKFIVGDLFLRIPDQNLRNIIKKTYKL